MNPVHKIKDSIKETMKHIDEIKNPIMKILEYFHVFIYPCETFIYPRDKTMYTFKMAFLWAKLLKPAGFPAPIIKTYTDPF